MDYSKLKKLEANLGYTFKNINFLNTALQHSSFVNEQPAEELQDNECLEFLGDAVLNLIVGHILMLRHPDLKEGDLSRMRAGLVNESQLASIARTLNMGSFIQLGKGEIQTNGRNKNSILSDTLEAVLAAVYLDGGLDTAFSIIEHHFSIYINTISTPDVNFDYKSQLQELVQFTHKVTPVYKVINETGPDHDKTFRVNVNVKDLMIEGTGKSKKTAEQNAAGNALEIMRNK